MQSQSQSSLQYIRYQVQARVDGADRDPTGDTVQFGFVSESSGTQPPSTWVAGSWETDPTVGFVARCLVGPGGVVTLASGDYHTWVKITDNPEVPVLMVGDLKIW